MALRMIPWSRRVNRIRRMRRIPWMGHVLRRWHESCSHDDRPIVVWVCWVVADTNQIDTWSIDSTSRAFTVSPYCYHYYHHHYVIFQEVCHPYHDCYYHHYFVIDTDLCHCASYCWSAEEAIQDYGGVTIGQLSSGAGEAPFQCLTEGSEYSLSFRFGQGIEAHWSIDPGEASPEGDSAFDYKQHHHSWAQEI